MEAGNCKLAAAALHTRVAAVAVDDVAVDDVAVDGADPAGEAACTDCTPARQLSEHAVDVAASPFYSAGIVGIAERTSGARTRGRRTGTRPGRLAQFALRNFGVRRSPAAGGSRPRVAAIELSGLMLVKFSLV